VARTHFWVAKIRERRYLRYAAASAALGLISFKQCQLAQNSAQSTYFRPPWAPLAPTEERPHGRVAGILSDPTQICALKKRTVFLPARVTQYVAVHHPEGEQPQK
jgi:hypothetical protein